MKLVFLFQCLIAINANIQAQQVSNFQPAPCVTPNNDVGVCVEVQKCPIFVDAIISQSKESYDFIRQSQCGSPNQDARHPKVCCGMYDNYLAQTTTVKTAKRVNVPYKDLLPKNCGKYLSTEVTVGLQILGGSEAELGQFPWMARLRHLRSDGLLSYGCAGFLISEKFVLTAAHCIYSKALEELGPIYQVQLGEHHTETDPDCMTASDLSKRCADSPQFLRTAKPIVHSEYSNDSQHYNDIAIIPLEKPAKMTEYIQPICLSTIPFENTLMWLSGWGKTETEQNSPVKLKVAVARADWTQCFNLYRTRGLTIRNSQLCAGGERGKDSCTGDSGGPLMVDRNSTWYAAGIVSVGLECGVEGWPAIYTNIYEYMPWIELVISQYLKQETEAKSDEEKTEEESSKLVEGHYIWGT